MILEGRTPICGEAIDKFKTNVMACVIVLWFWISQSHNQLGNDEWFALTHNLTKYLVGLRLLKERF